MKDTFQIKYLKSQEIDRTRWDACIKNADNSLIYANSICLDSICNWDALVLNNYEAVMPLPFRTKWRISYVYQVPFFQRLGVFGNNLSERLIASFYEEAARQFKFIHYNVHQVANNKNCKVLPRTNYIIDLSSKYQFIHSNFSKECQKNIKKAKDRGCVFSTNTNVQELIEIYKETYGKLHPSVTDKDYTKLTNLLHKGLNNDFAELYKIEDDNGETIFTAALLKDKNRLYYIMGAPTKDGRNHRAAYFFIDHVIQKYAGSNMTFDFEGSDIPNVADFYKKFNPQQETYFDVKINNLSFPLNLFK
jgi:hypothetical protein